MLCGKVRRRAVQAEDYWQGALLGILMRVQETYMQPPSTAWRAALLGNKPAHEIVRREVGFGG
jgi:hypothetical protein